MTQFIDTNAFLRLLTGLPDDQALRTHTYFKQLENGSVEATTSESVISEIVFVLGSHRNYGLSRADVAQAMRQVLAIEGLSLSQPDTIWEAVQLFESSTIPWVDCLCVAQMRSPGVEEIVSFDRHFDRFRDIVRVEP